MKSFGSLCLRGVGTVVTMAAVAFCSLNARAEIVFGNLGATDASPLGTTYTDVGLRKAGDINWLAQGFSTGAASQLRVDSVTLDVFGSSAGLLPLTVSIFSSSGGLPSAMLFTSAPTDVGGTDRYSFSFTSAVLQPNTEYFVVSNGGRWFTSTAAPQGQNGSGYLATRTAESQAQTMSPDGPWTAPGTGNQPSVSITAAAPISITAVPEPSSIGLAGVGILGVTVMQRRRKLKGKSHDAGDTRR